MMDLEDTLNLELPAYRVERLWVAGGASFRARLPEYPQCTGFGETPAEAVRAARHQLTHLRDAQAAVAVCELQDETSDRLREAIRTLVIRALV